MIFSCNEIIVVANHESREGRVGLRTDLRL